MWRGAIDTKTRKMWLIEIFLIQGIATEQKAAETIKKNENKES